MFQKKTPIIMVAVVATFIFSMAFTLSAASSQVGYIDLARLVKESQMGKAAMLDIEKLRQEKENLISEKLKTINGIKLNLETNQDKLKDDDKKDKIDELNTLIKDYKRMVDDAKEEIKKEDRAMVVQILKKADGALQKVARKKKFTMILKDPNAIGYIDPDVDITDDVLTELNKK
ncbi:MAG: OmpH family outer membrane protein [Pseudomonadota bacterium]